MYRFICVDTENDYRLVGTDDEVRAREWAEDELVYDTKTGLSLNADGVGGDAELEGLPPDDEGDAEDESDED